VNIPIITKTCQITREIYHLDIHQFNLSRVCSIFLYVTPKTVIIMDTGTSDDVNAILKFLKKIRIPLKAVRYLVPSHYHFDHFGGGWKLWEIIKKKNPEVKILTTEKTKEQLQDPNIHLKRVKRTFGKFIGKMVPLPNECAFDIVEPDKNIDLPGEEGANNLQLVSSPGHSYDHVCPTLFEDDRPKFMYLGEAAGALLHSQKIVTLSTSMPPEFNFMTYIESLDKLAKKKPLNTGYCHAGAIQGKELVNKALDENKSFSYFFRDFVSEKYLERLETRFVVEEFIKQEFKKRCDAPFRNLTANYILAVVYGQLVDLGLKKPK
ncbi:MAG: MBL fold metallo-hydrolase, partial [Candidatus Hodarchaeales archaeon]